MVEENEGSVLLNKAMTISDEGDKGSRERDLFVFWQTNLGWRKIWLIKN
jgi:hypothetical protein